MRFWALLALILFCVPGAVHALQADKAFHHYVSNTWSVQHGMPQISALSLAQDRDGYIWIGTQAGLARFDGVRFVEYTPKNESELPGIWIRALHASRAGRLWVGTYKGAAIHDGIGFMSVPAADTERWPTLDVYDFAEDEAGGIWVATAAGLFRAEGDRLHAVAGSPLLTQAVLSRREGLWVGAQGAVHRRTAQGWQTLPLPGDAATATVKRLLEAQGRIWAATTLGLFVHSPTGWKRFEQAPQLAQVPVDLLYADGDGNLWAGTDTGLARIRNGALAEYIDATGPGGIPGLRTAYEDREGNLWFGSQWKSLVRVTNSWTRRYSSAGGLNDPIVWSLSPDPDGRRIWVGSNDGVSLLENGRFALVARGNELPDSTAYNLLAEENRLWIGTRRGLAVIEHTGAQAGEVQQPGQFAPLASAQINGFLRDREGLWILTDAGLYRLQGERLRRFARADGLADPYTRSLYRTTEGRLLAGTQSGLFEMRGERFHPVGLGAGLPSGLDISAIHQLRDGGLVIGSIGEQTYFEHDGRWHSLGDAQGMPVNVPTAMAEFGGYLWIAGIRGISRVPIADLGALASGKIEHARGEMLLSDRGDPMSGQQGYCCNGAGTAKGFRRGDTFWLPSRDGVVAMNTDAVELNPVPPPVVIERVQIDEQWRHAASIRGTRLPADARDLGFEFTVLSFQDPKSTGVQYRMRGYDREWRSADALNRNARYTNLPPGDYVFEVRGSNNAGVSSIAPARFGFSIQPLFHETGWFYGLLALLLGALMFGGYRYQRHRHRLQRHALETLVQHRTEALENANRQLEEASQTDPLTGLRNRRYMARQMPIDFAYYDRQLDQGACQGEVMVFALIDIDHFKSVNDGFGHRAGDLVLQQFAQVLGALVRSGDYVVRWGGEEFLLVFRPMPSRNLSMVGERLRTAVKTHPFDIDEDQPLWLTASVGMAEYPLFRDHRGRLGWEAMLELADQAMYYVKTHGRDGWAAFRPTPTTDPATLLQDLRHDPDALLSQGRLQLVGSRSELTPA